jgi:pyruvate dehydrogenase E1 component beta subunit
VTAGDGQTVTLSGAINAALRDAMLEDERVVLMGEDIGRLGGVFRVTAGLQAEFGEERVIDTPLAESGIVGTAIGLALHGYRPVCEIQFDGFIYPAFDQIVSQLAKMRARSRGALSMPVVIRVPAAGGIGAVEHHSESNEAYFTHTAGLRVVSCSTPSDAYNLLREAIRSDDPVLFFEPKRRYWDKGVIELDDLGSSRARIVRTGTDLTLIAHGPSVAVAIAAAEAAEADGVSIGVVDLRSLAPLDMPTIISAVESTGRAIIVHEASTTGGIGGEIAARISEACFFLLEAPVLRVGAWDMPYPPSRTEKEFLPDVDRVLATIQESLVFGAQTRA